MFPAAELSQVCFHGVAPPILGANLRARSGRGAFGVAGMTARSGERSRPPEMEMDPFIGWMLERAGLDRRAYRAAAMQRRVPACLRQLRVGDAGAARRLLERKPELLPFALSTVLIGVSDFFRDAPVFDFLREGVLPELLARKPDGPRVCSVGASGGHELYSVAMLLAEAGAGEGGELRGVDCRSEATERAAAGVFSADDMAAVEPGRRARFFEPRGERWVARPELRRRMCWETADLFAFGGRGEWDLILFRNVAIYFEPAHSVAAWERLYGQLAPGGYLVTGKAEKPPGAWPLARVAPSIYQKPNA